MEIGEILNINFKTPQQKAVINLRFTSNYLAYHQNNFMMKYDISMPQFNILRILRGAQTALNIHEVKDRMIEKSPNTTRLMDKLILKGLIERSKKATDKRMIFVEINQKGLKLLEQIDSDPKMNLLFPKNMSNDEANLLSNLLDKLRNEFWEENKDL